MDVWGRGSRGRVFLLLVWRVHHGHSEAKWPGAFTDRAAHQNPRGTGSRALLLLTCCVALGKSFPFFGFTASRKDIRLSFI